MDMNPETIAKLKAMGLWNNDDERRLQQDRKKEEQTRQAKQKKKNQEMSRHDYSRQRSYNNRKYNSRKDSGATSGPPDHKVYSMTAPYGKQIDMPPDVRPGDIATAPYNFVPLPTAILPSPLDALLTNKSIAEASEAWKTYLTQGKHVSGHIELKIENLTPLYIGSGKDSGAKSFSPAGKEMIPGSELRGMVKNLYKMITCSVWRADEDTKDRHLYYRCLMAPKSQPYNYYLHEQYQDKMYDSAAKKKKVSPGFIVKRKGKWYLYPLLENKLHSIPIYQFMELFGLNDRDIKKSKIVWGHEEGRYGQTAYIQTGLLSTKKLRRSKAGLESATAEDRKSWDKQYYRKLCVDDIDKSQPTGMEIPDKVIEEYKNDDNRRGVNVLDQAIKNTDRPRKVAGIPAFDGIAPCFYLLDASGQVKSVGHGQSYRIPYDNSIMDVVDDAVKEDVVDFTDAVFGRSGRTSEDASWASRVMFEDAPAVANIRTGIAAESHILMQPNPTSFQLYLQQDNPEKLVFWDSADTTPKVRGYKMYWHSPANHDWHATATEKEINAGRKAGSQSLTKKIAPLLPGTIFHGSIRFCDLTPEELGALLKVFNLAENGEDIAFKIGMGKSIGLGSIRITPTLYVEDGSRYQKLFDANGWHTSEIEMKPDSYISAFETYVQQARQGKAESSYQSTLQALRQMLDFNNTKLKGWEKATAQMDAGFDQKSNRSTKSKWQDSKKEKSQDTRFLRRNVLPTISEVLQKVKEQQP